MFSIQRLVQCGVAVAMLAGMSNAASALSINSFALGGSSLQITPGAGASPATITFNPNFSIVLQDGGPVGDLVGLTGNITGAYDFDDPAGNTTALLTSSTLGNSFIIDDGTDIFSAGISLIQVQDGGLIIGAIDFSSSSYTGTNAVLTELSALIQNTPDLTITFQARPGESDDLDNLFSGGTNGGVTYSAVIGVSANPVVSVPEPAPLALLGLGLLCSVAFANRRRSASMS